MSSSRRVFLSHTSEFATYPKEKSFVDAAKDAVARARCAPCDMEYFTARDEKPAEYCKKCVCECDVYVGIIGLRYGSPVRDRPDVSYTELEFDAATEAPAMRRFIFLLDPEASVPVGRFTDLQYGDRQAQFRKRLSDAGVTCKSFRDAQELHTLIYQALKENEEERGEAKTRQVQIDWPEGKSPYRGLQWFTQEYAPLFFGRNGEVDELIGKMSEPEGRVVLVIGASGSGKSSVVSAGVWKAIMKEGRLPGCAQWVWQRIQPSDGDTPYDAVARGLKDAFQLAVRPKLTGAGPMLRDLLSRYLSQGQELILFIDQFEELFTSGFQDSDIQTFLVQLIGTAQNQTNRLRVVATIHSEFLGKLEAYESTLNLLNSPYRYHLGPMSPRMLQEMIERPAESTGYTFEPRLVERMLNDTGQEPGNLALVEYALKQLFERRTNRTFTMEAYEAIGGVVGAIATKANEVMAGLDEAVRGSFDTVFAELVHLDRERPPTRRRAALPMFGVNPAAVRLIDALAGQECRVLVTGGTGREAIVEVAHEKLFTAWPKLTQWIDESGDALRDIDHAEEEAKRWQEGGGNPQELWLGSRAKKVLEAIERFGKQPSSELERFLRPQEVLIVRLNQDLPHQERLLIGQKLAEFGDPRAGVGLRPDGVPDILWIEIPEGKIALEAVDHVFQVKPFKIAKYPVTNVQFEAFLNAADGYRNEEWWQDLDQRLEPDTPSWSEPNAPRETVSWYEAVAFCRWLKSKTGTSIRVPTEWEWQQAATGGDSQREYPWEGGWDVSRCNSVESRLNRTTAVGMYPRGATQQGVLDMAGNVWEWCLNEYEVPKQPEAVRIDKGGKRVIRGGSWTNIPVNLCASARDGSYADDRYSTVGFRLAQDMDP
jgi:hypothetical protein